MIYMQQFPILGTCNYYYYYPSYCNMLFIIIMHYNNSLSSIIPMPVCLFMTKPFCIHEYNVQYASCYDDNYYSLSLIS